MKPEADGVTSPGGEYEWLDCADAIWAASEALARASPAASQGLLLALLDVAQALPLRGARRG